MKFRNHFVVLALTSSLLAGFVSASAQWNKKPYTEWSDKEAQKVLNESPWGQTQIVSNTAREFNTGPARGTSTSGNLESSVDKINFRIRFLSSRPIRQAFSRLMTLNQKGAMPDQLKAFATADFPDYVIISVDVDSTDHKGQLQTAMTALQTRTTADLKNSTYLTGKGGTRVFLQEFQPPKKDGLGAKFIFPRIVDGQPFITEDTGEIKFSSDLAKDMTLTMRFKTKDMMFNGKLEY